MASTSGFTWNLQKTQDVEQLLNILRRSDYQAYSRRIKELLERLERYTPDLYKKILSDSNYKDRIITSLEGVLQRWRAQNPVIASEITDSEKFSLLRALVVAITKREWSQVQDLVSQLGFGPTVAENLETDEAFRHQSLQIMSDRLRDWAETRLQPYIPPAGSNPDVEAFDDELTRGYVVGDFRREVETPGVKSLRYNALMSNPRAVATAEKTLALEVTGDKEKFLENYHLNYYTADCEQEQSKKSCRELMAKTASDEICYNTLLRSFIVGRTGRDEPLTIFLAKYGRYNVIDAIFAELNKRMTDEQAYAAELSSDSDSDDEDEDEDPATKHLIYNGNMAYAAFDVAAVAASQKDVDKYQKYFQMAVELIRPVIGKIINFYGVHTYVEHLIYRFGKILEGGVDSGDFELVKMIASDIKTQLDQGIFPPQYGIRETVYDDQNIDTTLSKRAAQNGNIEMLDQLKASSQFELRSAVYGAIESCSSDVIAYLEPDMDRVYFESKHAKSVIADFVGKAVTRDCFTMFELCVRKTDASPEIIAHIPTPLGRVQIPIALKGKILDLYLQEYLHRFDSDQISLYLKYVVEYALTDKFEIAMKYPAFQVHARPKLYHYRYLIGRKFMGGEYGYDFETRYRMSKFLIDNGYVKVGSLGEENDGIPWDDAGDFRALADYYLQQGKDIDRKEYDETKRLLERSYRSAPSNENARTNINRIREDLSRLEPLVV